jgi:hypothetical protein
MASGHRKVRRGGQTPDELLALPEDGPGEGQHVVIERYTLGLREDGWGRSLWMGVIWVWLGMWDGPIGKEGRWTGRWVGGGSGKNRKSVSKEGMSTMD